MVNICKENNDFYEHYDTLIIQVKNKFEEKEDKCILKAFKDCSNIVKACLER